jgi:shikimate dehydrogenase
MNDRYAVIGNPVAHSKSPSIHRAFAQQTGQALQYRRLLAPLDGFAETVAAFRASGGRGLNITVPFKEQAFALATECSSRAQAARAVNTLCFEEDRIFGDNTDGVGLVRDITLNRHYALSARRILLLGAGGAARGIIAPLLESEPQTLTIANRTMAKAEALARQFAPALRPSTYAALAGQQFDVIINATSASLAGQLPPLPSGVFSADSLAYDLMYGKGETPFLQLARDQGAGQCVDGLGMLVEQAAESFFIWRGVRPQTLPVLDALRAAL